MGVYIEGLDRPRGEYMRIHIGFDGEVWDFRGSEWKLLGIKATDLDLVRCGECKYMRKYALRSDEPTGIWCHRWSVPRLITDDDFCSYGERRADEGINE